MRSGALRSHESTIATALAKLLLLQEYIGVEDQRYLCTGDLQHKLLIENRASQPPIMSARYFSANRPASRSFPHRSAAARDRSMAAFLQDELNVDHARDRAAAAAAAAASADAHAEATVLRDENERLRASEAHQAAAIRQLDYRLRHLQQRQAVLVERAGVPIGAEDAGAGGGGNSRPVNEGRGENDGGESVEGNEQTAAAALSSPSSRLVRGSATGAQNLPLSSSSFALASPSNERRASFTSLPERGLQRPHSRLEIDTGRSDENEDAGSNGRADRIGSDDAPSPHSIDTVAIVDGDADTDADDADNAAERRAHRSAVRRVLPVDAAHALPDAVLMGSLDQVSYK
jgi:hypothetical protein